MHISIRRCKTTFCSHYKGTAAYQKGAGIPVEAEGVGAGLAWPTCRSVPKTERVAHFKTQNVTTETPYWCTPEDMDGERMGQNDT